MVNRISFGKRRLRLKYYGPNSTDTAKVFVFSWKWAIFFPKTTGWISFIRVSIDIFSPDCQRMHFVPCNGSLRDPTIREQVFDLIRLDIRTRFPSKQQLSGFLSSKSQSIVLFLFKMIRNHCRFLLSFHQKVWLTYIAKNFVIVWCFFVSEMFASTASSCIS